MADQPRGVVDKGDEFDLCFGGAVSDVGAEQGVCLPTLVGEGFCESQPSLAFDLAFGLEQFVFVDQSAEGVRGNFVAKATAKPSSIAPALKKDCSGAMKSHPTPSVDSSTNTNCSKPRARSKANDDWPSQKPSQTSAGRPTHCSDPTSRTARPKHRSNSSPSSTTPHGCSATVSSSLPTTSPI